MLDERGLRYVVAGKIHEGPAVSERVVGARIHGNAAQPDSALWTHDFPGCALFVRVSADQFAAWAHKVRVRLPEVHVRALEVPVSRPQSARPAPRGRSPKGMEPYPFGVMLPPRGWSRTFCGIRRAQAGIEPCTLWTEESPRGTAPSPLGSGAPKRGQSRTSWARGIPERDGTIPFRDRRAQKGIEPRTLWARGIPARDGTSPKGILRSQRGGPQRAAPGIRSWRRARIPSKISDLADSRAYAGTSEVGVACPVRRSRVA